MSAKLAKLIELINILRMRRTPISVLDLAHRLNSHERSVRRYLDELINGFFAPIHKIQNGYVLDESEGKFELPSVWLTNGELISLAKILRLLEDMQGSVSETEEFMGIKKAVDGLLSKRRVEPSLFYKSIKLLPSQRQAHNDQAFSSICEAILSRKRILITYCDSRELVSKRTVSPLQIVCYQDNWYLDAFCHMRKALRQFRINRIEKATITGEGSKEISEQEHQQHFASAYGIFSGKAKHTAILRFFDDAAREVSQQQWHPKQTSEWQGRDYLLSFPYNKDQELTRDILKYANNLEVISPAKLRNKVARIAGEMAGLYSEGRNK